MVGSHLAEYLLANTDWDIYGMIRWRSPLDKILETIVGRANRGERCFFLYGDLRDTLAVQEVVARRGPILSFIWRRKASRARV